MFNKKIYYGSDLHLEFENSNFHTIAEIPHGDILILAGDTYTPWRITEKNYFLLVDFFEEVSKKFQYVIMIPGNHCYYYGYYEDTYNEIKTFIKRFDNIILLQDECIEIDGIPIFGSTLWSNMNNADFSAMRNIETNINDFDFIKKKRSYIEQYSLGSHIRAKEIVDFNNVTRTKLQQFNDTYYDKNKIIVTHFQPIFDRTAFEIYKFDSTTYYYYNNGLENFIQYGLKNCIWIAGHVHKNDIICVNNVDNVHLLTNARGYVFHKEAKKFKIMEINDNF